MLKFLNKNYITLHKGILHIFNYFGLLKVSPTYLFILKWFICKLFSVFVCFIFISYFCIKGVLFLILCSVFSNIIRKLITVHSCARNKCEWILCNILQKKKNLSSSFTQYGWIFFKLLYFLHMVYIMCLFIYLSKILKQNFICTMLHVPMTCASFPYL